MDSRGMQLARKDESTVKKQKVVMLSVKFNGTVDYTAGGTW